MKYVRTIIYEIPDMSYFKKTADIKDTETLRNYLDVMSEDELSDEIGLPINFKSNTLP